MFYNNIRRAKHCRIPDEKKKNLLMDFFLMEQEDK